MTTSSIHAEITVDVSKITCKEFMFDTVTLPDNIAYWLSGYYNGKRGNTVLDITALRDYVNKVEQYCLQNQDMTVMKAAETILNVNKKLSILPATSGLRSRQHQLIVQLHDLPDAIGIHDLKARQSSDPVVQEDFARLANYVIEFDRARFPRHRREDRKWCQ